MCKTYIVCDEDECLDEWTWCPDEVCEDMEVCDNIIVNPDDVDTSNPDSIPIECEDSEICDPDCITQTICT